MLLALVVWFASQHVAFGSVDCNASDSVNFIANNTADALAVAQCGTYKGDITLEPSVTGNVSLDGLEIIGDSTHGGSLNIIADLQISSISSDSLTTIGGWLHLANSSITTLSFPQLSSLGVFLDIVDVPALTELQLAHGLTAGLRTASFGFTNPTANISNTGLAELIGLLDGTNFDITITHNANLHTVSLLSKQIIMQTSSDGSNVDGTGNLLIGNNSASTSVDLPNLFSTAGAMTVGDCASLNIPLLALVNGSMELPNATFSSLSAPALERINGDLTLTGAFSDVSFPALTRIGGNLLVQSTKVVDCTPFKQLFISGNVGGTFSCTAATASTSSKSTSSATSTSGGSTTSSTSQPSGTPLPGGLSTGAIAGIAVGAVVVAIAALLAVFILVRSRRRAQSVGVTRSVGDKPGQGATYMNDRTGYKAEMDGTHHMVPSELPQGHYYDPRSELEATPNQVSELQADHRYR